MLSHVPPESGTPLPWRLSAAPDCPPARRPRLRVRCAPWGRARPHRAPALAAGPHPQQQLQPQQRPLPRGTRPARPRPPAPSPAQPGQSPPPSRRSSGARLACRPWPRPSGGSRRDPWWPKRGCEGAMAKGQGVDGSSSDRRNRRRRVSRRVSTLLTLRRLCMHSGGDTTVPCEGRLIDLVDEAWARETLPVEGAARR